MKKNNHQQWLIIVMAVYFQYMVIETAHAFHYQKDDLKLYFQTVVSTGVSMRVSDRHQALIGLPNGGSDYSVDSDTANLNHGKGKVFTNANNVNSDIGIDYKNYSAFTRLTFFYDPIAVNDKTLTRYGRDIAGSNFDVQDAYVQGKFNPDGHALDVRIGKQVINWGESLFILGGLNVINAIDLTKLRSAGDRVINALVANPMISSSYQLTDHLSIAHYYSFKYDRTKLDVCGSYFSIDDVACEGGLDISTGGYGLVAKRTPGYFSYRAEDIRPSNEGQQGVALRYLAPSLNDTEFGFYFINYNNHVPVVSAISGNPGDQPYYRYEYLDDLQVYGATVSGNIGSFSVQTEYTFRPAYPLQIETNEIFAAAQYFPSAQLSAVTGPGEVVTGYKQMPINQIQASILKDFGADNFLRADSVNLAAEAAMIYVSHYARKSDLRFEAPQTNLAAYLGVGSPALQTDGWADAFSWGYVLSASATYRRVISNIDLIPHFAFSHDVQGTTPLPLAQFIADRCSITIGLTARYLEQWSMDIDYTNFWGAGARNSLSDKDFINVTFKRWF